MLAVVHFWRLSEQADFQPGGVALFPADGVPQVRYDDQVDAGPARSSFESGVAMIAGRPLEVELLEAAARVSRSGLSGHLFLWVLLDVPAETTIAHLFAHYVTERRVAALPGSSPVDVELPFG